MAGPQNYCISPSHLVGKGKEAGANACLRKKPTWDGASQLQALRMINGFANPAGLQTQMRTELIAVRNTFGMNGKKNAGRRASGQERARLQLLNSKLAFAYKSSLGVHKSPTAYSWNCPESSTCNRLSDRFHPDYISLRFKRGSFFFFFFFFFKALLPSWTSQEMKTRWLRIAVYNIKLSSYGRKRVQKE